MAHQSPTTILVIDDHTVLRTALKLRLKKLDDSFTFYEAESRVQALMLAAKYSPALALLDLTLDGEVDLALITELHAVVPTMSVLVVSMHDERFYAERAIQAGAKGYVMKNEVAQSIIPAVQTALCGEVWLSEAMRQDAHSQASKEEQEKLKLLDPDEVSVFKLLGLGLNKAAIATQLGITEAAVETYRHCLKEKIGITSGAELYRFAALHAPALSAS